MRKYPAPGHMFLTIGISDDPDTSSKRVTIFSDIHVCREKLLTMSWSKSFSDQDICKDSYVLNALSRYD